MRRRREATTWTGRRGAMLLGPTEHRVARYLADRTHHGRIRIRTVDLARELRLERSEAYRITARLRELGLFGIENDRSGARGGRYYWRTAIPHDGGLAGLDARRHRIAWSRIQGHVRSRRAQVFGALGALRLRRAEGRLHDESIGHNPATAGPAGSPPTAAGPAGTFHELMRQSGLGDWFYREHLRRSS